MEADQREVAQRAEWAQRTADTLNWLIELCRLSDIPIQFDSGVDGEPVQAVLRATGNMAPGKEGARPGIFLT